MKLNCWEFKKCGREIGGGNARVLGLCPAATFQPLHGVHGGMNGGRACWVVAGTLCDNKVQGTFAQKHRDCSSCDFHEMVMAEEGDNFLVTLDLLRKIQGSF